MILLVCAVREELRFMPAPPPGAEVLVTGLGPVEAGIVTAARLARGDVDFVVNAGIAGVFRGRGNVGDAFAVREDHYVELTIGGSDGTLANGRFTLERVARSDAAAIALIERDERFRAGRGITVATMTTADEGALAHAQRHGCDVESMEGFAVLRAAELAGVPAIELRGISNYVGARETSGWDIAAGISGLETILTTFLTSYVAAAR